MWIMLSRYGVFSYASYTFFTPQHGSYKEKCPINGKFTCIYIYIYIYICIYIYIYISFIPSLLKSTYIIFYKHNNTLEYFTLLMIILICSIQITVIVINEYITSWGVLLDLILNKILIRDRWVKMENTIKLKIETDCFVILI
jgi:hypothetical protein